MALNIASVNMRGLRDPSKCVRLLGVTPKTLCWYCRSARDSLHLRSRLLGAGVVFSAYRKHCSAEVSLLIERSLDANVFVSDGGRLVVADVTIKSCEFWVVAVYTPNIAAERCSFFRRFGRFLDDPKWLVLVGNWNAILDQKIDKGRGRCYWVG